VTQALAYIQAHCHRQIYVEDIARHLGISRSALQHMFVVVNGRSLIEEINRARVKQAQHLLATTDIPMSQIASRCGFRRPQYFAKVFRTHAGMNARAYRLAAAKLPVVSNQTNEYQSNVQPSAQVPQ
jgi:LacI family transcriptional regulator